MGQCISNPGGAGRPRPRSGQAAQNERVANHLAASSLKGSLPPGTPTAQQVVPTHKPEQKCSDLYAFPSSASDGTSTQPSAAHVTTESLATRDTPPPRPSETVQALPNNAEHSLQGASQNQHLVAEQAEDLLGSKFPLASISKLSACARTSASPAYRHQDQQLAENKGATEDQGGKCADAEDIINNQAVCCGADARNEIGPRDLSFNEEARTIALAGRTHDVVRFGAPRPANEEARMATVRALRNMELKQCPELDLILKVVCRIWQAPSACITLLDSDQVFICSSEGMSSAHYPWAVAMCPWMLLTPHPTAMAVGDLTADARFSKSLHVAGGTRSYLTSPLVASNGHRLGAICFTDVKPRKFDAGDCRLMNNCAELAIRALEAHLNLSKRLGLPGPKNHSNKKGLASRSSNLLKSDGAGEAAAEKTRRASLMDTDDGTLMDEYRNRVRDLSEVDESVVLLLDTHTPGWTILYVSPSWEAVTGTDRTEAMGATLNEVMAHVSGDPRVVWEGVEREAAAGKAFVTPRVYCKASPAVTFYLSFRPAAHDDLDDQTVAVGVPSSVPQAASQTSAKLFFARLHTTPDPPANSCAQSLMQSPLLTTGRRLPPSIAINPVQGLTEIFQGLVVGQVLGQGSYGTVYHARWHGVDVAIKVQDMHIRSNEERLRAEFEVGLGQRLHHMSIVHTLSHASALLEQTGQSVLDSNDSHNWNAGLALAPLGFMLATASRASGFFGNDSNHPDGSSNPMDAGPAFIPFYAGEQDGAALAAAAAAANGSSGGAQAKNNNWLDAAGTLFSAALAYQKACGSMGGSTGDHPSGPHARGPLHLASVSTSAVVCVALPSGAQVPMLRKQRTGECDVGRGAPLPPAPWSGGGGGMPPLSVLLAMRGSSKSQHTGSPQCNANTSMNAASPTSGANPRLQSGRGAPVVPMAAAATVALAVSRRSLRKPPSSSRLGGPPSAIAAPVRVVAETPGGDGNGDADNLMGGITLMPYTAVRTGAEGGEGGDGGDCNDFVDDHLTATAGSGLAVAPAPVGEGAPPACLHPGANLSPSTPPSSENHPAGVAHQQGEAEAMSLALLPYTGLGAAAVAPEVAGAGHFVSGSFATFAAAGESTVQGVIEANLSGLSYPIDVRFWMVLEFMDKGSLQDAIDRGWLREGRTADHGPDYSAVLATAAEIAAAVAYLHSHDVVHGDLSAVNVLLQSVRHQGDGSKRAGEGADTAGRGFIAKISDFGLSMQLTRPDEAIKTVAYGTITHMAPEVLRNSALSKASDVYSVGVLLWQMATGSRPWAGLSHLQISVEVGSNLRSLQWPSAVHGGVRALGQRCLSAKPEERPTAAQLHSELGVLMRQVPQYG